MVNGYTQEGNHMSRRSGGYNSTSNDSRHRNNSVDPNLHCSQINLSSNSRRTNHPKRYRHRRNRGKSDSVCTESSTRTAQDEAGPRHIPGYYYNPSTRKYFKIASDNSGINGHTKADMDREKREMDRLSLYSKSRTSYNFSAVSNCAPIALLMKDLSLGRVSGVSSRLRLSETGLANINRNPSFIYENPLSAYYSVKGCQFLDASADATFLFGCWTTEAHSQNSVEEGLSIICYKANIDEKLAQKNAEIADRRTEKENETNPLNTMGLVFESSSEWAEMKDPSLVDICVAPVDTDVTCCLYATARSRMTSHGLRSRCSVFLQPISELSSPDSQDILNSPIYNSRWISDCSIYSCAWSGNKMRISLGLDDSAKIMDVVSEQNFVISSKRKNVLSQEFSPDGNIIYMGLRCEDVIQSDLRMPSKHVTGSLKGTRNASYLRVLTSAHPNCIITDTFAGELKLFDLRRPDRSLLKFAGHKNTHYRLPCYVDRDERFLFAVGEDEHTRAWSLTSGNLLCMVPSARPVEKRSDFPRVVYSDHWGGRHGNAALVIAAGDSCRIHQLDY